MKGNRGGTVLIVNDFRYHKHKTTGQSIHWRCWRTECRARVDTDIFDAQGDNPQIHPRNFQNHSHPVETELIHKNKFREAAVLEVLHDPTRPPHRVYKGEVCRERRQVQGGGIGNHSHRITQ